MAKPKSQAFIRIRAEVIRLVGLIPTGKFTTYGSIAIHMNVMARHVAFVMKSRKRCRGIESSAPMHESARTWTPSMLRHRNAGSRPKASRSTAKATFRTLIHISM